MQVTKPVKLGCCLGAVFLIWILYSYKDIPEPDITREPVMPAPSLQTTKTPDPVLRVDVYYECLCPDSRWEVIKSRNKERLLLLIFQVFCPQPPVTCCGEGGLSNGGQAVALRQGGDTGH